jgi:hypothetical protein
MEIEKAKRKFCQAQYNIKKTPCIRDGVTAI